MKIERYDVQSMTFGELKDGECFESDRDESGIYKIYMKTEDYEEINAVRLADGDLTGFYKSMPVRRVNAKVVVE